MRRSSAAVAAITAVLLAGCTTTKKDAQPAPSDAAVPPSAAAVQVLPSCAPAAMKAYTWPKPVPADLPRLPGVTLGETKQTKDGLTVVRFATTTSLRDGVVHIVNTLPPAGYVLGRGDAELTEADAPFNKGELRGVLRGIARTACSTDWLLAIAKARRGGTGTPLLPARPGVSPSPLPFGTG